MTRTRHEWIVDGNAITKREDSAANDESKQKYYPLTYYRPTNRAKSYRAFLLVMAVMPFVTTLSARDIEKVNGRDAAAKQAILQLRAGSPALTIPQLQSLTDADEIHTLGASQHTYLLHSRSMNIVAIVNRLKQHPDVGYVEPDYI